MLRYRDLQVNYHEYLEVEGFGELSRYMKYPALAYMVPRASQQQAAKFSMYNLSSVWVSNRLFDDNVGKNS